MVFIHITLNLEFKATLGFKASGRNVISAGAHGLSREKIELKLGNNLQSPIAITLAC